MGESPGFLVRTACPRANLGLTYCAKSVRMVFLGKNPEFTFCTKASGNAFYAQIQSVLSKTNTVCFIKKDLTKNMYCDILRFAG